MRSVYVRQTSAGRGQFLADQDVQFRQVSAGLLPQNYAMPLARDRDSDSWLTGEQILHAVGQPDPCGCDRSRRFHKRQTSCPVVKGGGASNDSKLRVTEGTLVFVVGFEWADIPQAFHKCPVAPFAGGKQLRKQLTANVIN